MNAERERIEWWIDRCVGRPLAWSVYLLWRLGWWSAWSAARACERLRRWRQARLARRRAAG
jgi:hypothetical protein